MNTHIPLKGIEVGDIGPKGGYQAKDNGYLYFNNFSIPRCSLLNRYTKVDSDGNFSISGNPRFAYATMMVTRIGIIYFASYNLVKALVIATRYSIQRKQFNTLEEGKSEKRIIDYQAQQAAFIPILAFAFSGFFTNVSGLYDEMMHKINTKNDFKLMKELHSLCSCLKAFYTEEAFAYLKTIRELCGGHGFLANSNLPYIIDVFAPFVTLEGDNYVMYQQTAKHIIKSVTDVLRGKKIKGNLEYINDIMSYNKYDLK
uniref:Acyl-CoA oxidase C-alpha1 domain-containing protein n=1 Tax=Euplotes harpa TaxID=151035 RepID=A0A7S3JMD4_9SPIT|mmetsp:Transcript_9569/g.10715  ORF Transcript_9569/g.10715 Transcript_9569/m.10715 type:complete len:257 (+) Transcript_9569:62-832(+)